ncbi:hypothetical protein TSACC_21669 [Terrimicrobium sacchariphilum]|uniref:Uncharacterized protein n=2 Tax=Terrimicrobium sacchariphilum TaxID=690879 RepID=A0A146G9I1_TERSA|nr:hypothetical protein TSACC_21669 [Terrimicrobium sacchariphilum]
MPPVSVGRMKREVRIPAALKLAARVMKIDEATLAEYLLECVTGAQAYQIAKAIKVGGWK